MFFPPSRSCAISSASCTFLQHPQPAAYGPRARFAAAGEVHRLANGVRPNRSSAPSISFRSFHHSSDQRDVVSNRSCSQETSRHEQAGDDARRSRFRGRPVTAFTCGSPVRMNVRRRPIADCAAIFLSSAFPRAVIHAGARVSSPQNNGRIVHCPRTWIIPPRAEVLRHPAIGHVEDGQARSRIRHTRRRVTLCCGLRERCGAHGRVADDRGVAGASGALCNG